MHAIYTNKNRTFILIKYKSQIVLNIMQHFDCSYPSSQSKESQTMKPEEAAPAANQSLGKIQQERSDALVRKINSQYILKARLSQDDISLLCSIVKAQLHGTFEERESQLAIEIDLYFKEKLGISILTEYFDKRPEEPSSENSQLALSTLLFYGTDFLSDRQFKNLLSSKCQLHISSPYNLIKVNHSCFRVTYPSKNQARLALLSMCGQIFSSSTTLTQQKIGTQWVEISSYEICGIQRKMFVRYAYMDELFLSLNQQRRYNEFSLALLGLKSYLFQRFKVRKEYKQIKKMVEFNRSSQRILKNEISENFQNQLNYQNTIDLCEESEENLIADVRKDEILVSHDEKLHDEREAEGKGEGKMEVEAENVKNNSENKTEVTKLFKTIKIKKKTKLQKQKNELELSEDSQELPEKKLERRRKNIASLGFAPISDNTMEIEVELVVQSQVPGLLNNQQISTEVEKSSKISESVANKSSETSSNEKPSDTNPPYKDKPSSNEPPSSDSNPPSNAGPPPNEKPSSSEKRAWLKDEFFALNLDWDEQEVILVSKI